MRSTKILERGPPGRPKGEYRSALHEGPPEKRAGGVRRVAAWASACLALLAITVGVWQLERARQGVGIVSQRLGTVPITVFRPVQPSGPTPVVLIAHGFAGSQQLMQPVALTLARNGYVAITFDFPGLGAMPRR